MAQNAGKACCRLCLAPESECVDIFKTQAADKLPIQTKINSCVQIQVSETEKLAPAGSRMKLRSGRLCSTESPQEMKLMVCEKNR